MRPLLPGKRLESRLEINYSQPVLPSFVNLIWLCFLGCLLFPAVSNGQDRVMRSADFWPELQVEYVLKNTSFFYFRNQYRRNFDNEFNYLREGNVTRLLERVQFRLGYEHMFNNVWCSGFTSAYAIERSRNLLFNELYVRHIGVFGKTRFSQRASYEHIFRWPTNTTGRFRLRAEVDRSFKIHKKAIRPRLSYEMFYNLSYQPQEQSIKAERLIDRGRLRFEIQYAFNQKFSVTPFVMEQVDFLEVEPGYDATGTLIRSGGKQNSIAPIMGIDLRYVIFQGGKPFPRTIQADTKN